jgi:hypothetical protein
MHQKEIPTTAFAFRAVTRLAAFHFPEVDRTDPHLTSEEKARFAVNAALLDLDIDWGAVQEQPRYRACIRTVMAERR